MIKPELSQSDFLKEKEEEFMDELISQYNQLNNRLTFALEKRNLRKNTSKE